MKKSTGRNGNSRRLRRWHRWLGTAAAAFLLLLAVSGIALNHSTGLQLDERHMRWEWLLDAYGIEAPAPAASFADGDRRATQLGRRLFIGDRDTGRHLERLSGFVVIGRLALAADSDRILLLTADGRYVQDLELPASADRLGRLEQRPVVDTGADLLIADAEVTAFEPWSSPEPALVAWSEPSDPPAALVAELARRYRGAGLTVERVLLDLHSGRILGVTGPLLMDAVAIVLIVLSITGLWLWNRRRSGENGNGRRVR